MLLALLLLLMPPLSLPYALEVVPACAGRPAPGPGRRRRCKSGDPTLTMG